MNKLLLSVAALAVAGTSFAADVTLNCNDINTTNDVVGTYEETKYKDDNSVQSYAHWQPLEKVVLGGYTFTFADGGGKTAPALYTTKNAGELQIRMYISNKVTISAPAGQTFGQISFTTSNPGTNFTGFTADLGKCSYDNNIVKWANETPVSSVTLTSSHTIRILSMVISTEGGTIDPGTNPGTGDGESFHLETNDIDTDNIVGDYVPADLTGEIAVYGHWQPVESCNIGDWTFDFSYGANDKNLPAIYESKTPGQKSIRLYNGSSMTLSAPADVKFSKIVMTLLSPNDTYSCTPSVGSYSYDAAAKTLTWENAEQVTNVTFSSAGTLKILAFDIYTDAQGGETPVKPENAIYSNSLMSEDCGFTFTTESAIQPWVISDKYGLKASAYIDNAINESDAYATSPVFDLTAVEGSAACTFEHAVNQFKLNNEMIAISEVGKYCTVETCEEGGAWEKVDVTFPGSFSWTYETATVDLSKYAGKKAQIRFHYVSTADVAGTWEIKNMKVTGSTAVSTVDVEEGEVRYFDLQGRQVVNPEKGLYIRVQGTKATKIML